MMISTTKTYLSDMPEGLKEFANLLFEEAIRAEEEGRVEDALVTYRALTRLNLDEQIDPVFAEKMITEFVERTIQRGSAALLDTRGVFEQLANLTELLPRLQSLQTCSGQGQ